MIRSTANAIATIEPIVIILIVPSPPVDGSSIPLLFSTSIVFATYLSKNVSVAVAVAIEEAMK